MNKSIKSITCLGFALALLNCESSNTGPSMSLDTAPTLPTVESMQIPDLDGAGNGQALSKSSGLNHGIAALIVTYWTVATRLGLVVPVALFAAVHNNTPSLVGESWVWQAGNAEHNAKLTARAENSKIRWTMTVTGGELNDFVWYTGVSTVDGKEGNWTFYDPATKAANVSFKYTTSVTGGTVKAEVVDTQDTAYGNYLSWTRTGSSYSLEGYDEVENEKGIIIWDSLTGAGQISNMTKNEKYCWNSRSEGQENIPCP